MMGWKWICILSDKFVLWANQDYVRYRVFVKGCVYDILISSLIIFIPKLYPD